MKYKKTAALILTVSVIMGCSAAEPIMRALAKDEYPQADAVLGAEKENYPPIAVNAEFKTYTDVKLCGIFSVNKKGGDKCSFDICTLPKKGTIELTEEGFEYTPKKGKSGKDCFEFIATDALGNKSNRARISIEICKRAAKDSFIYSDMENSGAHFAALYLRERDILCGETFGGESFLYPEQVMTRAQFVALVASVSEMALPTVSVGTGLSDNEDIPVWARPYVAAAINCGVICGETSADGNRVFRADDPISRAEAAVIVDRALELADDGRSASFADAETIPAWAMQSVVNAAAGGMLPVFADNTVRASDQVTREDAVQMLYEMACYVEKRQNSGGFLKSLFN